MKYFAALPLMASLAAAQSTYTMGAVAAVSSASGPQTFTVVVGGVKAAATGAPVPVLQYTPESITANQGDMVIFEFMQKNHTATQSSFADPCKAMPGGKDSGFMPNPDGKAGVTWNMTVDTTEPIWMYCRQTTGTHCGHGMVFAINAAPTGNKTFANYKALAVSINGTALSSAAIQQVGATAAAAASTVTVLAGGGAAAAATGTAAAAGALSTATGQGTTNDGQACSCSCLCGQSAFPAMAAVNNFGGFAAVGS